MAAKEQAAKERPASSIGIAVRISWTSGDCCMVRGYERRPKVKGVKAFHLVGKAVAWPGTLSEHPQIAPERPVHVVKSVVCTVRYALRPDVSRPPHSEQQKTSMSRMNLASLSMICSGEETTRTKEPGCDSHSAHCSATATASSSEPHLATSPAFDLACTTARPTAHCCAAHSAHMTVR